jgi:hypothetical protein
MDEKRSTCKVLIEKHEGKTKQKVIDFDGRIILKWILEK